jgi:hypothetical protein
VSVLTFAELVGKLEEIIAAHSIDTTLEKARQYCNDAGIGQAQTELLDAIAQLEQRQENRRIAGAAERAAKEALDDAIAEASWDAEASLIEEAGKTYVMRGERKVLVGATDRPKWAAAQARKAPAVIDATRRLAAAREKSEAARDAVDIGERYLAACQSRVEAAIAVLATLRRALPNPPTSNPARSTT